MGNSCTSYIKATVDINFPAEHVCCGLCPLLETYSRLQCRRTGEYLWDKALVGMYCPLMLEKGEEKDGD